MVLLSGAFPERFLAVGVSALLVWSSVLGKYSSAEVLSSVSFGRLSVVLLSVLQETWIADLNFGGLAFDGRSQILKSLRVLATRGCLARLMFLRPGKIQGTVYADYPLLRLLALLGGMLLVSAEDLRVFYLALELQSLALYVLAASARGSAYSTEAGLKYFRLGAFASGLFLLGASLIYGYLGTTNYGEIGLLQGETGPTAIINVGFALMVAAVMFKLAAAPFHRWSPDVIEGSPSTSSRFFAIVTKIAALGALIRLGYGPFYGPWRDRLGSIAFMSGLSMTIAALAALGQRRMKRFLAYSGIGHIGFRLRGLSCGTPEGLQATLRYLAIYAIGSLGVWAAVISRPLKFFTDLGGLARRQPALARVFAVSMFSMAGVPPMAGFYAKLTVFFAAMEAGNYLLATLGILASVVGGFYYLRIIKIRYFEPARDKISETNGNTVTMGAAWVMALSTFITITLLLNPTLPTVMMKIVTSY